VPKENLPSAHGHDVIPLHRRMGEMEEEHSFHYTHSNIHHIWEMWRGPQLCHISYPGSGGERERLSLSQMLFWLGGFGGSMTPLEAYPIPHAQIFPGVWLLGGAGSRAGSCPSWQLVLKKVMPTATILPILHLGLSWLWELKNELCLGGRWPTSKLFHINYSKSPSLFL
jgi:hypothetical protein